MRHPGAVGAESSFGGQRNSLSPAQAPDRSDRGLLAYAHFLPSSSRPTLPRSSGVMAKLNRHSALNVKHHGSVIAQNLGESLILVDRHARTVAVLLREIDVLRPRLLDDAAESLRGNAFTHELVERFRVSFRATDAASMLDAVVAGLGIGVLPCFLAATSPDAVCIETVGPPEPEAIWLVTRPDAARLERVRAVTAWLLEIFSRNTGTLRRRTKYAGGKGAASEPVRHKSPTTNPGQHNGNIWVSAATGCRRFAAAHWSREARISLAGAADGERRG